MLIADITVAVAIGSDQNELVGVGEEDQTHLGQVSFVLNWIVLDRVFAIVDDKDLKGERKNDVFLFSKNTIAR